MSALLACGSKKKAEDACKKAADRMVPDRKPLSVQDVDKLRDTLTKVCTSDKWSDDIVRCISDAKTERDQERCLLKLSKDQTERLERAVLAAAGDDGSPDSKEPAPSMTKYADEICACKDVACTQKLLPEIEKFSNENAGKEVDRAAADRYNADLTRLEKCIENLERLQLQ